MGTIFISAIAFSLDARAGNKISTLSTTNYTPTDQQVGANQSATALMTAIQFSWRRGSWGTILLAPTGGMIGISSNNSPALSTPLAFTASQHTTFVRNFFISRGLPNDQIKNASISASLEGHEQLGVSPANGVLKFYTTSISRQSLAGISVVDSMANAACLNADTCAFEVVYWPLIPAPTVSDASAFRDRLQDPSQLQAYQNTLPTANKQGRVVIRHSDWHTIPFVSYAVYDVMDGSRLRHFDASSKEVFLPVEALTPLPESSHPW